RTLPCPASGSRWQAAQDGAPPGSWRVAILGLGGGTAWRVLDGALPEDTALSGLGIEIDPTVVALSRAYLDLPAPGAALDVRAGLDARVGLRASEGGFDQVVLDTYANQVEIPAHLATVEFLREVRDALRPGGWLTVNVGAFGLDDPLLEAIATSAATAFESPLLALQVPFSRNVTLVARRDGALPELDAGGVGEPAIDALLAPRALPGAARRIEPLRNGASSGRGLLTDDRSPTERLQRQAIARARERDLPAAASGRAWIERFDPGGDNVLERARSASREAEFAGDLEAARAIAMAGLESDPEDLELLLRMGATALSLSRPDAAQAPLDALAAALETASGMAPETLQWWNERLATNRDWLDTQLEGRRARDAASDRAVRTLRLSSVGIGLTALLLVALPRRR
ncbi:MAG: fused MFS/spermidine synthase, partial [Planctomycetota bacterium]